MSGNGTQLKGMNILDVEACALSNAWDDEEGLNMVLVVVGNSELELSAEFLGVNNFHYVIIALTQSEAASCTYSISSTTMGVTVKGKIKEGNDGLGNYNFSSIYM